MPTSPSSINSLSPLPSPPILQFSAPDEQPRNKVNFLSKDADLRRPSVQFQLHNAEATARPDSNKPRRPKLQGRNSSPPPPSSYRSRVSFDTFDNQDAPELSYVLTHKHKDFTSSKHSRLFLCGTDQNDYSDFALEWLLDELVDDGDEVVCFRVVDKDSKINSDTSLEQRRYKDEAHKLMEHIKSKNKDYEKSINLVLEFAVGKVQESIQSLIARYSPACLIVGTRGKSLGGIQGLLPGSISKYCLQNSPVPVIVVRPSAKREKKKRKRHADPNRKSYLGILEKSGADSNTMLDNIESPNLSGQEDGQAREEEARAVARAIGLPTYLTEGVDFRRKSSSDTSDTAALSKITSAKSDITSGADSPSPTGPLSPDEPSSAKWRTQNWQSRPDEDLNSPGENGTER
ncbi:hypothetical protein MMC11_007125 [Xylographa trunciseda]|nr:hypothetical protein [Xylographa trunciseda]